MTPVSAPHIPPPTLVVVESPYAARHPDGQWDAAGVEANLKYLRAALADCLRRGEAPFASHGLYTQPGVLDDRIPDERRKGIEYGFAWNRQARTSVFYLDRGFSSGMGEGLRDAVRYDRDVAVRFLHGVDIRVADEVAELFHYWKKEFGSFSSFYYEIGLANASSR